MKRLYVVALCVPVSLLVASFAVCGDMCGHVDEEFLKKHVSLDSFKIDSKKSIGGLCEIVLLAQSKALTLYAGKGFVISGNLFRDKRNLSDDAIAAARKGIFAKNMPLLEQSVYFTYVPKSGKKSSLYFFTDPLCPYCHRIEGRIVELAEKFGVEIRVVLLAINGDRARKKCIEAKCRDIGFSEYVSMAWRSSPPADKDQCRKGMVANKLADALSDALLIDGVPAFYLGDGSFVSGADFEALADAVKKSASPGAN